MTLRGKFRSKFSDSSIYPLLRILYRFVSSVIFSLLRFLFQKISSLIGLDLLFARYATTTLPLRRPLIVFRGFKGLTLIGRKHYLSRKKIVLNYLNNQEVQNFVSNIQDFSGQSICPISILETALIKEGVYENVLARSYPAGFASHSIGNDQGSDIYIPRESSFFHFFIQVAPFILRKVETNKLWLDLDSGTSNYEILEELGLKVEELPTRVDLRFTSQVPIQHGHYPSSTEAHLIRKRLSERGYFREPKRNLYITRNGNLNGRRVQNEVELLALLSQFNFEVVDPGMLSFRQQLSTFSQAKVVVAPHGAALSHIVNFPLEARILELNGDSDIRWHIRKMARDLGIDHHLLLGKSHCDGSFTVNLELIEILIQKLSSDF